MMPALKTAFEANLADGVELGASVCVWQHGQELCHFCGGEARPGAAWSADTLVPIFSATKVASAACLLLALHDCCQSPELEVGAIWPQFPQPRCTVAQLLSHQSGLAALDECAPHDDVEACRRAIERSRPRWSPPAHGYHPHSIGPMLDILMLELTGQRLGAFWEERVRRPLGLDFYIGLPPSEQHRVAHLRAPRMRGRMPRSSFYSQYFDPASSVHRAFHCLTGLPTPREMNGLAAWECASPARGGVASARGLACFYQCLLGHVPGSPFTPELLEWMTTPQCSGEDLTLCCHTSFACGAMLEPAELFGRGGFGHAGAGGCHAFAEPASGCSFAYVMNGMELGILPGARVRRLLAAFAEDRS